MFTLRYNRVKQTVTAAAPRLARAPDPVEHYTVFTETLVELGTFAVLDELQQKGHTLKYADWPEHFDVVVTRREDGTGQVQHRDRRMKHMDCETGDPRFALTLIAYRFAGVKNIIRKTCTEQR